MYRYELKENLTSIELSINLLNEIENLIINKVVSLFKFDEQRVRNSLTIRIIEGKSTSEIFSVTEYEPKFFPDYTNEVKVSLYINNLEGIIVRINLLFSSDSSYVSIDISSETAKDNATAILHAINEKVRENRNRNFLFHNLILDIFLFFIFIINFFISFKFKNLSLKWTILNLMINICLPFYYFFLKKWKPYVVFDSIRQNHNQKLANQIMNWFLSSCLLSGILIPILKSIFTK